MAYNSFPYTSMHELNLDYLLNKSKEVDANVQAAAGSASAAANSATASANSAESSLAYSRNSANSAAAAEASAADSADSAAASEESARQAAAAAGDPATFTASSQLTDTSKIYVYIGETGTYTYGHWYYYANGTWVDGGVYGTWTTDIALSDTSTNAIQNKTVTLEFDRRNAFNGYTSYKWLPGRVATNGATIDPSAATGSGYHAVVDCTNIDFFFFTNNGANSTYRPFAFADADGNKLATATTNVCNRFLISKPAGAVTLVCNTGYLDNAVLLSGNWTDLLGKYNQLEDNTVRATYGSGLWDFTSGSYLNSITYMNRVYQAKSSPAIYDTDVKVTCDADYMFKATVYDPVNEVWLQHQTWTSSSQADYIKAGSTFVMEMSPDPAVTTFVINDLSEFVSHFHVEPIEKTNAFDHEYMSVQKAKIASHRGYRGDPTLPENSLPAISKAGSLGAWAIEIDVRETFDGYFVLMHDETINRTTTGTGTVSEMTLAQIESYNLLGGDGTLKVPTLEAALKTIRQYGCVAYLDIKSINRVSSLENIINILKQTSYMNNVIMGVYSEEQGDWLEVRYPKLLKMFTYDAVTNYATEIPRLAGKYTNVSVSYPTEITSAASMAALCHTYDMILCMYASSSWSAQKSYFYAGVDIVVSNDNLTYA